jgi:hypothetical protein
VGVGYFWDDNKLGNLENMYSGQAFWIEGAHSLKSGLTLTGRYTYEQANYSFIGFSGHTNSNFVVEGRTNYYERIYLSFDLGVSKALRLTGGHFVEPGLGFTYLRQLFVGSSLYLYKDENGFFGEGYAELDIHNEICLAVGFSYYYRSKSGYCLGMRTGFNKWIGIPWLEQKYFTPFVGLYF